MKTADNLLLVCCHFKHTYNYLWYVCWSKVAWDSWWLTVTRECSAVYWTRVTLWTTGRGDASNQKNLKYFPGSQPSRKVKVGKKMIFSLRWWARNYIPVCSRHHYCTSTGKESLVKLTQTSAKILTEKCMNRLREIFYSTCSESGPCAHLIFIIIIETFCVSQFISLSVNDFSSSKKEVRSWTEKCFYFSHEIEHKEWWHLRTGTGGEQMLIPCEHTWT